LRTATGVHKCQYGLSFRSIDTSCCPGYLHYLVAGDCKNGNFLLVESVTMK
jgi:hypothetical protein